MTTERVVDITVCDKASGRTRVFTTELSTLQRTMHFFAPILQKQLDAEARVARDDGASAPASRLALVVNCEIDIFAWLLEWAEGKAPALQVGDALSILLASNFLRMDSLSDEALLYLRDHLVEVLLSGVDMHCVPGELLGRLCAITTETHLAEAMLQLAERDMIGHCNRDFLDAMARHLALDRLAHCPPAAVVEGDITRQVSSASPAAEQEEEKEGQRSSSAASSTANAGADTGLRWCGLCGTLYDASAIERATEVDRSNADNDDVAWAPPACPALEQRTDLTLGLHGDLLVTHTCSTQSPAQLDAPAMVTGQLERWSWRVLGGTHYVGCSACHRLVALIDTVAHECHGDGANDAGVFVPLSSAESARDVQTLVRWFAWLATHDLVRPARRDVPVATEVISGALSPLTADEATTTSNAAVPSVTLSLPTVGVVAMAARAATPSTSGRAAMLSGGGGCGVTAAQGGWAAHPALVEDVFAATAGTAAGVPNVDLIMFHEHGLAVELDRLLTASNQTAEEPTSCVWRSFVSPGSPGYAAMATLFTANTLQAE